MKKIFSYNTDIKKNAYLNWRTEKHEPIHNLNTLADEYFQNAIFSIKECLNDNWDCKADSLIFPILFSINHAIELYEKALMWSINILLGYNSTYTENHDIRGIWYTVKQKIKEFGFSYGREKSSFENMIIPLEKYLSEIYQNIMTDNLSEAYYNIDFSRYPTNINLENHFYINKCENVVIDLENLLEVVLALNDCLSRLSSTYYDLVVCSWQMKIEE